MFNGRMVIGILIAIATVGTGWIAQTSVVNAQDSTLGLQKHEKEAYACYSIFSPGATRHTFLIDNNGQLINSWTSDYYSIFHDYLLENGNLLRTVNFTRLTIEDVFAGRNVQGERNGFQELTWDGTVVWEYECPFQHHDIEPLPNGNVLMITEEIVSGKDAINLGCNPDRLGDVSQYSFVRGVHISLPDLGPGTQFLTRIVEIEKTGPHSGTVVWEWRLKDHLIQDYDDTRKNFGVVAEHPELININYLDSDYFWAHVNSVDYNQDLDQILLSSRAFNEIWVIDHSTTTDEAAAHRGGRYGKGGDLLYRWGNPRAYDRGTCQDQLFVGQHDAEWIAPGLPGEGNILVFNNNDPSIPGCHSLEDTAAIMEIVPPLDESGAYPKLDDDSVYGPSQPVWHYTPEGADKFICETAGGSQRLANGNTRVCHSTQGRIFEVTSEGEIVWQYKVPVAGILGNTDIFNCQCYGPDYPGLAGKDLMPGEVLESYEQYAELDVKSTTGGRIIFPATVTGSYGDGQVMTIQSRALRPCYEFDGWHVALGSVTIHHPDEEWTTIEMGSQDSVITADYVLKENPYTSTSVNYGLLWSRWIFRLSRCIA